MMRVSQIQSTLGIESIGLDKRSGALLTAWLLSMVGLPIARWVLGDVAIPYLVFLAALLQAGAVYSIKLRHWGHKRSLVVFVSVAILTWLAEAIGSKTGFPFGAYSYTEVLQPQILGVPLLIPFAWFMMLPPSWAVASAILGKYSRANRFLLFPVVSAIAITAWDLFLDPQMVQWNFWVWENPEGYFGIPWSNYAGWLLTAGVITLIIRPAPLPLMPLGLVYGLVWALQSIGQAFFWNQPGPALVGCVTMGAIFIAAVLRLRSAEQ